MFDEQLIERLRNAAISASRHAYCPYSDFSVGAAVLTDGGLIVPGCNVENASYGLTICAERNAIFAAVAQGARSIHAIGIYTPTPAATAPCGACRQVIYEFGAESDVICFSDGDEILIHKITDLLPGAFGPLDLAKPQDTPHVGERFATG